MKTTYLITVYILFGIIGLSQSKPDSLTTYTFFGKVVENIKLEALDSVNVTLINFYTGNTVTTKVDSFGRFEFKIKKEYIDSSFRLLLQCENYHPKRFDFSIDKPVSGIGINLNQYLDMELTHFFIIGCGWGPEIDDFYYDKGKKLPNEVGMLEVEKLILFMNEDTNRIIEIGSHTNCRGSNRKNQKLSDKRAKAIIKYVVSNGISEKRIFGKGYGETRPLNNCCEEECSEDEHRLNDRTEFRVVNRYNDYNGTHSF